MIRGSKSIGRNLFGELAQVPEPDMNKGRSARLIADRDELLLHRFYWYMRNPRNAYDWVVRQVGKEFALSETTVSTILTQKHGQLAAVRDAKPTVETMRTQWPWMSWQEG